MFECSDYFFKADCMWTSLERFFSEDPLSGGTKSEWVGQHMTKAIGCVLIGGGPTNTLAYWQYLTHGQETKAKALCFHWRWMQLLFNASANTHQYDDFSSKWQNMPHTNRDSTMSLKHLVNSFCAWKYERWISKVLFKAEVNMAQVKC